MKRMVYSAVAAGLMGLRAETVAVYAERFNGDSPAVDFRNGAYLGAIPA